jgi:hypothetical protein
VPARAATVRTATRPCRSRRLAPFRPRPASRTARVDRVFAGVDDLDRATDQQRTDDELDDRATDNLIRPADLVTDPNDPNNLHASLPEHQPIIDAYLEAISALHLTWAEWPLDPSSDRLLAAPISAHWLETAVNAGMVERTQDNLVLD